MSKQGSDQEKIHVVLVDDRFWLSAARDTYTFLLLVALVAVGWARDSTTLQWIGGFLWMLTIVSKAHSLGKKSRFTLKEAKAEIDRHISEPPNE